MRATFVAILAILILIGVMLLRCDEPVSLKYATRAEAEADKPFARGWLPPLIPASAKAIAMSNDLDLNTSAGEFRFDPADHDRFVGKLERAATEDEDGYLAYSYEDWIFWISPDRSRCKFYMRLGRGTKP